jgi:hypothetical protein
MFVFKTTDDKYYRDYYTTVTDIQEATFFKTRDDAKKTAFTCKGEILEVDVTVKFKRYQVKCGELYYAEEDYFSVNNEDSILFTGEDTFVLLQKRYHWLDLTKEYE